MPCSRSPEGVPAPGGGPAQGGSAPGGACSGEVGGCGFVETQPPESRRLLLRTVRILLECILVYFKLTKNALANSGNSQIKYLFNHGMIKLRAPIGRFCSLVENVFF